MALQLGLFAAAPDSSADEWSCAAIDYSTASEHVERWHYSETMPKGRNICFGLYIGGRLYAVAVYGNGVNPYQESYLTRITGLEVTLQNLVELKRLARSDPKRNYPMTRFMAWCHRRLKDQHKIRYVISFSDPDQGHTGCLYKAANYISLGKTKAEMHVVDRDGVRRHRRVAYRYAKRNDMSIGEARDELGFQCVKTTPRDRWFLPLVARDRKKILNNRER